MMNIKKIQITIVLFLIVLFPLTTVLTFQAAGSQNEFSVSNVFTEGTGSFVEDFTTASYRDPATTAWGWGGGVVTNARNFSWTPLDFYNTTYPVTSLDVQGRKAYYVCYNRITTLESINAMNLEDPSNLRFMSTRSSLGDALTCAVDGDVLYTGRDQSDNNQNFNTYNVSDPFNLGASGVYLGYIDNPYAAITDIDPEGPFVYYAAYNATATRSFYVANVTNPDVIYGITPQWDCNLTLGLEVDCQLAYIAASTEGFYVLNVSDNWYPTELDWVDTPGNATDVLIKGGFAFIADGMAGVTVVNIRDPTNIQIVANYNTGGYARRLVAQGNTLFVANSNQGVIVLDIADPTHPTYVTEINLFSHVWDLDLYGGYLIVGTDDGINSFQICAGNGITDFIDGAYGNPFNEFEVWDVRVIDGIAYIAGGEDGFLIVNVRNPMQPTLVYQSDVSGVDFKKLDVNGQFAFLVDIFGIFIFDITDLSNVQYIEYVFGLGLTDVHVQGQILYISWYEGLAVLNISSIYDSYYIEVYDGGFTNVTALWVQGPHAYLTEWLGGTHSCVHVLDISDYSDIKLCYSRFRYSYNYDIHVDGDFLHLAGNTLGNGMWIYNVTNPFSMSIVDNVVRNSYGVWNFGPYVLSADYTEGVSLINATNKALITGEGLYADATNAIQITTSGDYVYVANISSLVILRFFESAGDTYLPGTRIEQSNIVDTVDGQYINETLNVDDYVTLSN